MDSTAIILLVTLGVLLLLSGCFSATETAYSCINRIRLKNMEGNKRAQLALRLAEDYDKLLSTILIGNNIVNIASASLATLLFTKWFGELGVTLSTIVMTVLVLIFGEISPKTIARENPDGFAIATARVVRAVVIVFTPLNKLFSYWQRLVVRIFRTKRDMGMTEQELRTIIDEVENDGAIDEQESEIMRSALDFNGLNAGDILTPRVDVEAVELHAAVGELKKKFMASQYSRIPVYEDSLDRIVGLVHEKDLFAKLDDPSVTIQRLMTEPVFAAPTMEIGALLRLLQSKKSHMAVIVDEFGGTQGIVTLEDILEQLVGEIWDEHDEVEIDIRQVAENILIVRGAAAIEDLFETLDRPLPDGADYTTVSGWVMENLDKIPAKGDAFAYSGMRVRVLKVQARRAELVKITLEKHRQTETQEEA